MIVLSSTTYAPKSVTVRRFAASFDIGAVTRRGTRRKTLDGGVYIDDRGYTQLDNSISLRFNTLDLEEIDLSIIHNLAKVKQCVVAYADISGSYVYICRIRSLRITKDVRIIIELIERVSI